MGSKSDYLENEILDHILGGADWARPATVWVSLETTLQDDAAGGVEVAPADWTNYARAEVTNNPTNWPAAAAGVKANGTAISFGPATLAAGPVTVVGFGIWDALTAGNLLFWGALAVSKAVAATDTVVFTVGDLTITED